MPLINCPVCKKENISDSAESCPSCGHGIKNHFEAIKQEEENQKMEALKKEMYQKKLDNIRMPEKPVYGKGWTICGIISICWGILFTILIQEPSQLFISFSGIVFFIAGKHNYNIAYERYQRALNNFEQFKKDEVARNQAVAAQRNQAPRCPKCGSTNFDMVKRNWSATTGFMTNKVDRVCRNCKHRF